MPGMTWKVEEGHHASHTARQEPNSADPQTGLLPPIAEVRKSGRLKIKVNSLGCVGPELAPDKPVIAYFGDSAIMGFHDDSWPSRVDIPGAQTLNAALAGAQMSTMVERYDTLKQEVAFTAVIACLGWHDLIYHEAGENYWASQLERFLGDHVTGFGTIATCMTPDFRIRGFQPLLNRDMTASDSEYFSFLGDLEPSQERVDRLLDLIERYNMFLEWFCVKNGALILDLHAILLPARYEDAPVDFFDICHSRRHAWPKIARYVTETLREPVTAAIEAKAGHLRRNVTRANLPLTATLVSAGVFKDDNFALVDVGASGGIEPHWHAFGDSLRAFGFDPLSEEVKRLNAASESSKIRYHPAFVTYKRYDELFPVALRSDRLATHDNQPFGRTSCIRALDQSGRDYTRTYVDGSHTGTLTDKYLELDEYFAPDTKLNVDFIKIDTDGSDYEVLLGSRKLLKNSPVLGLFVECQFHGPVHNEANLFSNIDKLLRQAGFSLFDISVYRYSRAVLPMRFVYEVPAQTERGQVLWGNALFLRDAGDSEYEKMWGVALSPLKIAKLACIFEIFGLQDCAAELIAKYATEFSDLMDTEKCLNLLTPPLGGQNVTFAEYNKAFEDDTAHFFPNRRPRATPPKL